jgi:hypothetical protein
MRKDCYLTPPAAPNSPSLELKTPSLPPSPRLLGLGIKFRFIRQAQDTEFIEVRGQPLPTGRQAVPTEGGERPTEPLD